MYKIVTKGNELELWATGFYGESGKKKAQKYIDEKDKNKVLIVVPAK